MTTADGNTFGYDANGNMVSGADRIPLPGTLQVLTGSGSTETTRYVGGLYEQISKGSLTRRHHIYANGQVYFQFHGLRKAA